MTQALKRIAFLTSRNMVDPGPEARVDAFEHRLELEALAPACAEAGFALVEQVWDDPGFDPAAFDGIVIGTAWDYMEKHGAFLAALERFDAAAPLLNPRATVIWNSDKTYLRDLENAGLPVVPTEWAARADAVSIARAFERFDCDRLVVKPQVGASAWRQARVTKGDPLPPDSEMPPAACLIQPFLSAAETEGETTLLFFDRQFSHALVKKPKAGDYRTQSMYGASEAAVTPPDDAIETAQAALEAVAGDLLYGRVDLMRRGDGRFAIMELELVEPYLYPEQGPDLGANYARALGRLIK
ncbi:ATP-grasp domain-containing protein [Hyphobacterium marinum]|uniref:ATP-grasp domain-containing protein n=1 Tax=Hyphobacterium marinum TaxID=3116574 RepID=A0ABU7LV02_9PROT|nr:hypothetical protein [Hyphobacterium sp. Y6023]MEE2565393.1 hypothetical protein [Hyphobacterium sp. Y6023]